MVNTVTMVTDSTSPGSDLYPPLHIDRHGNQRPPGRNQPATPYRSSKWSYLSWEFREGSPYCKECQSQGLTVPALYTAHRIPWPLCNFWDRTNWIPLCKKHHREKRRRDKIQLQAELRKV